MRMWMADTVIMCSQHLKGEHVELHMCDGSLRKGVSIDGYIANDLLEPRSMQARHDQVVAELVRRGGWRHKSPLGQPRTDHLPYEQLNHIINRQNSLAELIRRCPECRERYQNFKQGELK